MTYKIRIYIFILSKTHKWLFHFGKISLGAGPQANLKIWDYEDGYKNLVLSAVGGAQYELSESFFIDARFNYGFTNILDDNPAGQEAKSRVDDNT